MRPWWLYNCHCNDTLILLAPHSLNNVPGELFLFDLGLIICFHKVEQNSNDNLAREGGGDRQRETDRDRDTERDTHRETETETEKQRDRERDRETETERDRDRET